MLIDVIFSVILENVKHAAMITQVEKNLYMILNLYKKF